MTAGMLQLLLKYRFPVFISTKSDLILRDIELLKAIDKAAILPPDLQHSLKRGVVLSVSLSSLDDKIAAMLEPGAIAPLRRLELVKTFKQEGFLAGVNAIPVLPYISDSGEALEKIIAAASFYRADYILTGGLTLFGTGKADSKTLYYQFLQKYDASLLPAYENLYGHDYYAQRQYQHQLKNEAARLCSKYGIRTTIIE